jgi:hypothetical protein
VGIEGKTMRCSAYRLAGGQRFLVPSEMAGALIEALNNHKDVTLSLASYRTLFKPEDFSSKYEKLLHPFALQNPFHLPF